MTVELLLFLDDHDDQGQKKEENHNAGDEEREVSTLVGGIPILLDDVEDRIELVGTHVGAERVVARSGEFQVAQGTAEVLLSAKVLNKSEKKKDFLEKFSIFFEESNYCIIFAV